MGSDSESPIVLVDEFPTTRGLKVYLERGNFGRVISFNPHRGLGLTLPEGLRKVRAVVYEPTFFMGEAGGVLRSFLDEVVQKVENNRVIALSAALRGDVDEAGLPYRYYLQKPVAFSAISYLMGLPEW